jgi:glycosyltransferase involved in cell wall biosynthesis
VTLPSVAIVIPVLRRPHRAAVVATAFANAATGPQHVVFVANADDEAEVAAVEALRSVDLIVIDNRRHGDWARKVNTAYRLTTDPLLLLCGDDVNPRSGWHDEVANAYAQGWGVIGTQDLGNRRVLAGLHSTHPVVARWYADRYGTVDGPGAVVSEAYDHNWVDDELVETARARGLWTFCNAAIIEHLHPIWGKGVMDDVYALGRRAFDADRRTRDMRSPRWTSLSPLPRTEVTGGATSPQSAP